MLFQWLRGGIEFHSLTLKTEWLLGCFLQPHLQRHTAHNKHCGLCRSREHRQRRNFICSTCNVHLCVRVPKEKRKSFYSKWNEAPRLFEPTTFSTTTSPTATQNTTQPTINIVTNASCSVTRNPPRIRSAKGSRRRFSREIMNRHHKLFLIATHHINLLRVIKIAFQMKVTWSDLPETVVISHLQKLKTPLMYVSQVISKCNRVVFTLLVTVTEGTHTKFMMTVAFSGRVLSNIRQSTKYLSILRLNCAQNVVQIKNQWTFNFPLSKIRQFLSKMIQSIGFVYLLVIKQFLPVVFKSTANGVNTHSVVFQSKKVPNRRPTDVER